VSKAAKHDHDAALSLHDLPPNWRRRANELRDWAAAEAAATALERAADELDDTLRWRGSEPLTLAQAASESGYNAESLGRMVRQGKVPNVGRTNAPRIRRGDLPHKPAVVSQPAPTYDAVADARALVSRRSRGGARRDQA